MSNAVKRIREELGISIEEQAQKLGLSVSMYEKIEYGYRKPSRQFIEKLKVTYPYIDTNIFFDNKFTTNEQIKNNS